MSDNPTFSYEQISTINAFQRLWTEVAMFMRAYINTAIEGSPRADINAQRLLEMSKDFRNTFFVFYGPVIADRFNNLFTSFIAKSTNVIQGFLANDPEMVNASVRSWYSDADALATFLASINSNWDQFQWRSLLTQYIQLKIQMITSMVAGDYRREMQIYDRVLDLANTMGFYTASGLIGQEWPT